MRGGLPRCDGGWWARYLDTTESRLARPPPADKRTSLLSRARRARPRDLVGRNGRIYQLVRLDVMCRHTVGLNYVALGIEHVGTSDAEILQDRAQMRASLELTAWLVDRFHIRIRNVIAHNESLSSPYHKELYKPWAHQTHADWKHADMDVYRGKLRALLRADAAR
jgi:N-acetyl-anhydromuramyl-L-alanine amidase AmpD